MGNRCFPTEIDGIIGIIEQAELVKALYNVQLIGSLNGVSLEEVNISTNLRKHEKTLNISIPLFICMQLSKKKIRINCFDSIK